MNRKKAIILGGGVAGLSAAHELAERDFEVHVYEKLSVPGGKARSTNVPGSEGHGGLPLPGEHGFRFFPRFYRHITDTMARIPVENNRTAVKNLVDTERVYIARVNAPAIVVVDRFPRNLNDLEAIIKELHPGVPFPAGSERFFAARIWQLMTSSLERRIEEYERIGWWQYIGGDHFAGDPNEKNYQTFFAEGFTRTLVAAQPRIASTKTVGDILLQLIFDMILPGVSSDRVLNGPTNDVWIDPWLKYLTSLKGADGQQLVHYYFNSEVKEIHFDSKTELIQGVSIEVGREMQKVTGDFYISAMPVEKISPLINKEMLTMDPTLGYLSQLAKSVNWMNGVQYYLPEDVPIAKGHVLCLESEWAVTAISQRQFWADPYHDLSRYYDGKIGGILSVDVSDWFKPAPIFVPDKETGGIKPLMLEGKQVEKAAHDCTKPEIIGTVWYQLKESINYGSDQKLTEYLFSNLDDDIERRKYIKVNPDQEGPFLKYGAPSEHMGDSEPLLVNATGTWFLRPEAFTMIRNFFLTGDYVKTNTDLATMEGANESARRAVNAILDDIGSKAPKCKVWALHEPGAMAHWRHLDKLRFRKGMRWKEKFSIWKLILFSILSFFGRLFKL